MKVENLRKSSVSLLSSNSPFHSNETYQKRIKALKRKLLRDKILSSSCYMTFGLSGLMYILLNIFLKKFISHNLIENTIKSIYLAGIFVLFFWTLEHFTYILSLFCGFEQNFNLFKNSIKNYYSIAILLISLSLSILSFIKPIYKRKNRN